MELYNLNVITPFKDLSLKTLKKTISPLRNQNYIHINHFIVYDNSCEDLLLSSNLSENVATDFYNVREICAEKSGIYSPINQVLEKLNKEDFYLVLGAGDILNIRNKIETYNQDDFILIPYCLSSDREKVINKFFSSIMLGMPYCHNAIIFKKNNLLYNKNYKLASDYDYLIRYLFELLKNKNENISLEFFENYSSEISDSALVTYDSENGLSKEKRIEGYREMAIIVLKYFGIFKVLIFCIHLILKRFKYIKI